MWPLPLSPLVCSLPWFVAGPSTFPSTLGVLYRPWRAWYYHPNSPLLLLKLHISPLQTCSSASSRISSTHTHTLFLSLVCLTKLFCFCLLYLDLSHMIVVLVIFLKCCFLKLKWEKSLGLVKNKFKKNKTKLAALGFSKFQMAVKVSTSSFKKKLVTHSPKSYFILVWVHPLDASLSSGHIVMFAVAS